MYTLQAREGISALDCLFFIYSAFDIFYFGVL